jgi:hypothetical protein
MNTVGLVLRHALARWRWWHAPLGVVLGSWTLLYMGAPLQPDARLDKLITPWLYNVLQFGLPLVAGLLLADASVAHGARARLAYPLTAAAVVLGGVFVIGPALMPWLGSVPGWNFRNDWWLAMGVGLPVGLLVAGYAAQRQHAEQLERVRAAEAERLQRAQALQGARLAALQARVEPRLLFDALGRVADRIDDAPAEADERLADTIAMLRALLPSAAGGGIAALTSLARELELVRLQARLADDEALGPARLQFEVAPEAAAAAVAPTLVPRWLRTLAPAASAWTLHAQVAGGLVQLRLVPQGSPMPETLATGALADIQAALADVHGPQAGLSHDDHGFGLHWPLPSPP